MPSHMQTLPWPTPHREREAPPRNSRGGLNIEDDLRTDGHTQYITENLTLVRSFGDHLFDRATRSPQGAQIRLLAGFLSWWCLSVTPTITVVAGGHPAPATSAMSLSLVEVTGGSASGRHATFERWLKDPGSLCEGASR